MGNRQWQIKNGVRTDYTCNDANQLVSEITAGVTTDSVFDANGNMTVKKIGGVTVAQWGYDWENRQASYTDLLNPLNNSTYGYDAAGRRVSRTVNGVVEKYLLDGANVEADYDGSNVLQASYVTPFLDDNLLMARNSSIYYFFHDGLGSVRSLIRSDQILFDKYDYYAFGEMLSETGGVTNRYKFTGREWDNESSTYHYRARQYNPSIGRFTRRDPLGCKAGINIYSYVTNNPILYVDPLGMQWSSTSTLSADQKQAMERALCLLEQIDPQRAALMRTLLANGQVFDAAPEREGNDPQGETIHDPDGGDPFILVNHNIIQRANSPFGSVADYRELAITLGHEAVHAVSPVVKDAPYPLGKPQRVTAGHDAAFDRLRNTQVQITCGRKENYESPGRGHLPGPNDKWVIWVLRTVTTNALNIASAKCNIPIQGGGETSCAGDEEEISRTTTPPK